LAGVPGFEPGLSVLETDVLTVDTIPLRILPIANFDYRLVANWKSAIGNLKLSLGLFMIRVLTATPAKFAELQTIRGCLLVLCRDVVAAFANRALKYNVVARHNSQISNSLFQILLFQISRVSDLFISNLRSQISNSET
jgi:hypothetical protein